MAVLQEDKQQQGELSTSGSCRRRNNSHMVLKCYSKLALAN